MKKNNEIIISLWNSLPVTIYTVNLECHPAQRLIRNWQSITLMKNQTNIQQKNRIIGQSS